VASRSWRNVSGRAWQPRLSSASLREARLWLAGATLSSGAIYGLYLVLVAFLPSHVTKPRIYLFGALQYGDARPFIFVFAVGLLFACAAIAWRISSNPANAVLRFWALVPPIVFACALLLTMPLTSRDIFYYTMIGRVLGTYGANPYLVPPSAFPADPLFQYTNWPDYTAPYGPLWLLLSAGLTLLGGTSVLWNVVLFKLVALLGYLACGGLIWAILRARGRPGLPGVVLWLWNPLVLLEYPGAGHNDVLMLAGLLLGLWLYVTRRVRLALAVVTAAAMIKSVAIVALPLLLWHHLPPLGGWRARGRATMRLLWLPALIVVGTMGPFWAGAAMLGPVNESNHYYSSVGHVVRIALEWFLAPRLAGNLVRGTIVLALVGSYLLILRRVRGDNDRLLAGVAGTMFVLIALWPFFVPWYSTWAVALVATLGSRRRGIQTLVLCAGATLSYLLQLYLPLRMAVSVEFRSALSALLIFGPFALSFIPWGALPLRRRMPAPTGPLPPAHAEPQPEVP